MRIKDLLTAALILGTVALLADLLRRETTLEGHAFAVDGDTLDLAGTRVRLKGIDAPELGQECTRAGRPWTCGEAARRVLQEALRAGPVACTASGRDKYGRPVALCRAGGVDLSEHMARQGFAVAYLGRAYAGAEAEARAAGRGIWGASFEAPADWRAAHPRGS
ncbi:thermonuclease family protein [Xanthobacter autotrophicus]|uniref:thermonuclease family protein n=1 Tax=Xanthobacter TaxID=279 RepID=UPI0024AA9FA5|nr:thermonuclease family protein [Xanthobacter autotrophicus]MDI4666350.1 thermonuclease family protein [Xanthobacter autotrophicus]